MCSFCLALAYLEGLLAVRIALEIDAFFVQVALLEMTSTLHRDMGIVEEAIPDGVVSFFYIHRSLFNFMFLLLLVVVCLLHVQFCVPNSGEEFRLLYREYDAQETAEAKAVKDLDRLEMVLQAWSYEEGTRECCGTMVVPASFRCFIQLSSPFIFDVIASYPLNT